MRLVAVPRLFACLLVFATVCVVTTYARAIPFSNTGPITIPDSGTASPYPSIIGVSGLTGAISKVTVTLSGISHTFPDDLGALLVGPGGQSTYLFSGPGGGLDISNLTWTFDDAAAGPLPADGLLVSGTFQPSNYNADIFSPPAPGGGYAVQLSTFSGLNPNGDWLLYVQDFAPQDEGGISGGWSIDITTDANGTLVPEPGILALLGLGAVGLLGFRGRRRARSA